MEFYTATGRWRCTDIGTRVVVAIRFDTCDSSWYSGPPYSVSESVFDEYDVEGGARWRRTRYRRRQSRARRPESAPSLSRLYIQTYTR